MTHDTYRPRSWDDVTGQPTDEIRAMIDGKFTPNFLFHGPPGTGKTTVAYLIAKEIQGSRDELMVRNASDERGIDTIRDEIIPVVDQTTLSGAPRVIFLDEMESMTGEAQRALRQPMDESPAVFILACNNVEAVHDALISRCDTYKFGSLPGQAIRDRIDQIVDAEGVDLSDEALKDISARADGDMRTAIQRYNQYARGAREQDDTPATSPDSSSFEQSAREYLEGGD